MCIINLEARYVLLLELDSRAVILKMFPNCANDFLLLNFSQANVRRSVSVIHE